LAWPLSSLGPSQYVLETDRKTGRVVDVPEKRHRREEAPHHVSDKGSLDRHRGKPDLPVAAGPDIAPSDMSCDPDHANKKHDVTDQSREAHLVEYLEIGVVIDELMVGHDVKVINPNAE
jgi:hypothetical protein